MSTRAGSSSGRMGRTKKRPAPGLNFLLKFARIGPDRERASLGPSSA